MSDTLEERIKRLKDGALKEIQKKHGQESIILGEGQFKNVEIVCSSGSLSLDNALGVGGFPKGRIIEIVGNESCGKSSVTLINIAECQRSGKVCAYLDVEQAFDPEYAKKLGVNVTNLILSQPSTMEDTFDIIHSLVKSKEVDYIVVDSTNAMLSKRIFEGEVGDANMGRSALLMSQELPKVNVECANTGCTIVFISQVRSKIGVMFGSPEVYGVGNAMKFFASIRIKVTKSDQVKDDTMGQEAIDINASVFKNKVAPPYKKAKFTLLTGKLDSDSNEQYGIDTYKEIIDFAVDYGIIGKGGAWYKYTINGNEERWQGAPNVIKYFKDNENDFQELKSKVIEKINQEKNKNKPVEGSFADVKEEVKKERKPREVKEVVVEETKENEPVV